jgi:hypothetical protein
LFVCSSISILLMLEEKLLNFLNESIF